MPNAAQSIMSVLQTANPNTLPDMLRAQRVDRLFRPISASITLAVPAAVVALTALRNDGVNIVLEANSPVEANELLPAIRFARTLRVTAGAAAAGVRALADAAGTPSATLATLSLDGATLTFEANVTTFIITYFGASAISPLTDAHIPSP